MLGTERAVALPQARRQLYMDQHANPEGYKTWLSGLRGTGPQSFAWVSVDENDNDPKVLLTYVAEALNAVQPVGERVFDALASPASWVPWAGRSATGYRVRVDDEALVALVLDDVHILHNQECRAALSVLADHVPDRSRLVLAGGPSRRCGPGGCAPRAGF